MEPTVGSNWNPRHSLKDFDPRRWQSELTFLKTYLNQAVWNTAPRVVILSAIVRRVEGLSRVQAELVKFSVVAMMRAIRNLHDEVLPELQRILDRLSELEEVRISPQHQEDPR